MTHAATAMSKGSGARDFARFRPDRAQGMICTEILKRRFSDRVSHTAVDACRTAVEFVRWDFVAY
jgi:hypothetical protein